MPGRFLVVGGGGREAAFAARLSEDSEVCAIMPHRNPQIMSCAERSGGECLIGDSDDPQAVLGFAKKCSADYVFVNADQPLANGVVDLLLENGIRAIGGTKEASRIEWDKIHSIRLTEEACPGFVPFYRVASTAGEADAMIAEFEGRGLKVVVKPRGLTGGKGVKVMPEHLPTYDSCREYARQLLGSGDGGVLLVERLDGIEFTIMGITDGTNLVMAPASYDYPFREEGARGPGTGGMGCFTGPGRLLPFMTESDWNDCRGVMCRVIDQMREGGLRFTGVLNGGFFKTAGGIKFMEWNSRFGDPEVLNVLSVMEGSFARLLVHLWDGTLSGDSVSFLPRASVTKYLVAKEYPGPSDAAIPFAVDVDAAAAMGAEVFFASCVGVSGTRYETIKKSRVCAIGAVAGGIADASGLVNRAIEECVDGRLEYRADIGSEGSLAGLDAARARLEPVPKG